MDRDVRRELDLANSTLKDYSPYQKYEYVDVTFGTANADKDILHDLRPSNPDNIHYQIVKADRSTTIYQDLSGTRKVWTTGVLYLRSSVANAVVRILLTVER